uniref:Universal stress protein family n=1 Tax=Nonomuraea gerenzanensis TaxID=93944 RepID=A0A1M4EFR3_9ACTN|nr:Universal stress protein family [Nonomuraea gerenzanensis]
MGVDDSEDSLRAVEWAAAEAGRRRRPLLIVHAFIWPLMNVPLGPAPGAPPEGGLRHAAERILETARDRARMVAPEVGITTELPEGEAFAVLLRHSRQAELLVVGSRGLGEVGGLLLGSVGAKLGAEAACPVVVVRGSARPDGPVVAGIGDPGESEAVLDFACAHAARTADPLMLAHVADRGGPPLAEPELARWQERFPTVTIDQESLTGRPGKALTDAAARASLLVVGSHHRHEFSALLHGSVSRNVLHHAACPVAIVPLTAQEFSGSRHEPEGLSGHS